MIKNLKLLREKAGLSQRGLADIIGVSQQSINKYENQSTEPDIGTLILLSDLFGVSIDELVGRKQTEGSHISPCEMQLIRRYGSLNAEQKRCVDAILLYMEQANRAADPDTGKADPV